MSYDIKCPYCDRDLDIDHDDGYGYEDGPTYQQECHWCDKNFTFTTSISYNYDVQKADCLNGGNHDWHPTISYPKEFTKMRCKMCDEERKPTSDELVLIVQSQIK